MEKRKSKIIGLIGTIFIHLCVLLLLFMIYIHRPIREEEGGVPVMLGNIEFSQGENNGMSMTDVDILPEEEMVSEEISVEKIEQDMLVQVEEETVTVQTKKEKAKESESKEKIKPKEKTEAEKQAEAQKKAAETANKRIAGAFGKGSHMESHGSKTTGNGVEGSLDGNSSIGKNTGIGGYGTFDLNGRSLGTGGLPRPVYNVRDEGRVVVTIIVNSLGEVISTSINKRTNTVNSALRKAAEDAAKKARFNAIDEVNNQSGTITYYFKLK